MFAKIARRAFSTSAAQNYKVTVLGAAGGIGQPLSLLLKLNDKVTELSLYDIKGAKGVAADVSHIPTNSTVKGYTPEDTDGLKDALSGSNVVVIPAGVPRKPGMTRDDLFNINAGIVRDLATAIGKYSPKSMVLIISNPVNSTVPIVAEVLKKQNVYDPKRLFGVTTLDVIRSSRFVSELVKTDPTYEQVTVVGGHSGITIVPLLSQNKHKESAYSAETKAALINRIQFGGDEVVKAKDGSGSATLSMAVAGARFASSVLRGLDGEADIIEPSFVDSPLFKDEGIDFFASPVTLGPEGVAKIHGLGELSADEQEMITKAKDALKGDIIKGQEFVTKQK